MNTNQHHENQEAENANPKRPLFGSKFCKARSRDEIEFYPYGEQGVLHRIRLDDIDTLAKLAMFVRRLRRNSFLGDFPLAAIGDLIEFHAFLLDPAKTDMIATTFDRAEGIGLAHGNYCHQTTDDGIEIRVGDNRLKLRPGVFSDCGADLNYALDELSDKPWFTVAVKSELFDFAAGRGISTVIENS